MDLEVVGRHALLFDDDTAAAFVNSGNALVEWHFLQIDRYDVRHLLSAPPASRRRNRTGEIIIIEDPSLQSQLDKERYLDLPSHSDQPEVEDDEKPLDTGGYRAVTFSYGNSDDSADQKNPAAGMESYGFLPPFPLPGNLLQSLPPTEKIHKIIARTAIFVRKHGGQSEIVLRVKQGNNPTFGFLMPDHKLHAYFRFLVDHPDVLNSELDGRFLDDSKKDEHNNGGALYLLGSVYGSGEEEDGNDSTKTEKDVHHDIASIVNQTISHDSNKMESKANFCKDESAFRNPILSNREKILSVSKNSSIPTSRSGSVKGIKKEEKSSLCSTAAGAGRSPSLEVTSKIEPLILEPPPELKRLIEKLVEFIVRNGKQFEATLIEQDSKHGRFSFLLPTNPYHSYYLKVLQTAQESNGIGKASNSASRKASPLKEEDGIPLESDRKEKFKMVIGKSKKETQETESKGTQNESGTTVDAAAAAAILQAATRGIKNSNSSVVPLTEEQKLKAERLKRAKLFVAILKSGAAPLKTGASRGSSMEPLEPGSEVNLNGKKREVSLAPADDIRPVTGEKPEKNYFDEEQIERFSKRKYRSKSDVCAEEDNEDYERRSRRKYRSKSNRHEDDDENENSKEMERKRYRQRHQSHSSSQENKDYAKSSEGDSSNNKPYKSIHRPHHSPEKDSECEDNDLRRSTKKSGSHHSSHGSLRKRRASNHIHEEDEPDNDRRNHKHSKKKHRSSHRSRDKHGHSSKDKRSKRHHKHYSSSNDDSSLNKRKERELEEGEISSRVTQECGDIATGHVSREKYVDVASSHQRASSQPAETIAEVPNDLRAKVRAMLMATRM